MADFADTGAGHVEAVHMIPGTAVVVRIQKAVGIVAVMGNHTVYLVPRIDDFGVVGHS